MNIDSCFKVGHIIKAHGLKGEVVAELDTDHPIEYSELESVFVEINQKLVPFFIENINLQNTLKGTNTSKKAILKFEDIDKIEDTQSLLKLPLFLPLEMLPESNEEELYFSGIIGFKVHDKNQGILGTVKEIYEKQGQDLISMEHKGKEVFIPIDESIILKIDRRKKILYVDLPQGLVDLYLEQE
jgi:16S rRNA processing protein RimM